MYFKKLEIIGFKSFSEKTILQFEPGITAIVGPNGCGKSNIFDAIRWVLGEQSAKSLRGSDMQDVIFNGTDQKDPLGMAEVTLSFDNQKNFFNIGTEEVAITRRLFRSGESEYLLNKTPVRLKDITELLLGTGIGAESYSIVAQGKIDLVLSSKPDERRIVFDEASGITKYKADKRETMRKLEDTEANLARVNDIIVEVKRQIGSLERQAHKARKYKDAFEELKTKETQGAVLQIKELLSHKQHLEEEIQKLSEQETLYTTRVQEQESRISNRQVELKEAESRMMEVKEELLNLDNTILRAHEKIKLNGERIEEMSKQNTHLQEQIRQLTLKQSDDEKKLNAHRSDYALIKESVEGKRRLLAEQDERITALTESSKAAHERIRQAKQRIVALAMQISNTKNEINDFSSKQQIFIARRKRLELEKAKINEEESLTAENLREVTLEVENLQARVQELTQSINTAESGLGIEESGLSSLQKEEHDCEHSLFALQSHKEFLQKLRTKYEDIGETMDAVIYLNKPPRERVSGLVVKIHDDREPVSSAEGVRFCGEAKPMELDTRAIEEKIGQLSAQLEGLRVSMKQREAHIGELKEQKASLQKALREQEIAFANKETSRKTIEDQYNKIKQEADVIVIELADVDRELNALSQNLANRKEYATGLQCEQREVESSILNDEESIARDTKSREDALVAVTQTRTELDGLTQRITSDESTLRILEEAFRQDSDNLRNSREQTEEIRKKTAALSGEMEAAETVIAEATLRRQERQEVLKHLEGNYTAVADGAHDAVVKIEQEREELNRVKGRLYDIRMEAKDIEYRIMSIKTRMTEAYKVEVDASADSYENIDASELLSQIQELKRRVDSYGAVNLVAIEEYDELKQRYDFLIQQQSDLQSAKESLHQAILKINRTTKQLFLETFEKVKEEFRNYFRILFNGGDAQVFLTDEHDPLESGIEIICRPPGKKLQNVLLLSGGEKSLSAIALIFAIFKVKPSPFCVLDEIDAALDEANVGRLGIILQEFSQISQFIVITHNKRTIANANVMYGITMQESGVSKIVSVKFNESEETEEKDKELVSS